MDSSAVKEYNRYEDSALRLTDPRFVSDNAETVNAHRQAAAGLGYGKNHADHYSYYAVKGKSYAAREVGKTPGPMQEFDRWMGDTQEVCIYIYTCLLYHFVHVYMKSRI